MRSLHGLALNVLGICKDCWLTDFWQNCVAEDIICTTEGALWTNSLKFGADQTVMAFPPESIVWSSIQNCFDGIMVDRLFSLMNVSTTSSLWRPSIGANPVVHSFATTLQLNFRIDKYIRSLFKKIVVYHFSNYMDNLGRFNFLNKIQSSSSYEIFYIDSSSSTNSFDNIFVWEKEQLATNLGK